MSGAGRSREALLGGQACPCPSLRVDVVSGETRLRFPLPCGVSDLIYYLKDISMARTSGVQELSECIFLEKKIHSFN